jgi:aquaporin Z
MNMNKYFVEFLGTMFFLFVILMSSSIGPSELQPVIIGAGLAIAIFVGGKISGGNFNPAVSVMMTAANKLSTSDLLPYIIAQILGGLAALQLTKVMKF